MSRDFPDWIDVERAAQAGRRFVGDVRLDWMPRVTDLLDAPAEADVIGFEVIASRDEQDIARLEVRVHGAVPMTCQRTLTRYWQAIDSRSTVAAVAGEHELAGLPEDLEPKLVSEGRVRVVELVEDELLLALPLVPRDPESAPVENAGDRFESVPDADDENPFAVLARLRSTDD